MKEPGLWGVAAALVQHHRTKKEIRKIQEENYVNQGITMYEPSNIEAFFDESAPLGNMVFSGGLNRIRARAIARAIECAYIQGFTPIVLHSLNNELEQVISGYFGAGYVCAVNKGNPIYDPFIGLSNEEICHLVIHSSPKDNVINAVGKNYINGITDFIRAKGLTPYCHMYITCPHMTLIDKVNNAEQSKIITSNQASNILSEIMQGEMERSSIESFFYSLSSQAGNIIACKRMLPYAVNVDIASKRKQILLVDVQSSLNVALINILCNEIGNLLSQGKRVMLILDDIHLSGKNVLLDLIKMSSANCSIIISSKDAFTVFSGEDTLFVPYIGSCSKVILSKHVSAYSCQKWAEYIGFYDKQEISSTHSNNANFVGQWGLGATNTTSISIKRENIIKPEFIQRMRDDQDIVIDKSSGEIAIAEMV